MPLTPEQSARLQAWLDRKEVAGSCPMCHASHWRKGAIVTTLPFDGETAAIEGPYLATVQLVCDNCAYVVQFAAKPIGLL